MLQKLRQFLFGKPLDVKDPKLFHNVSLAAFLAWVGLGADGLSSSAYGPEEAYRALGTHTHLAIFLVGMTAITIFVISIAYSNLIEHFPGGGGGYLVASKLLGAKAGVVSGCALLIDYVLTISVSVASGCDAVFSFLPQHWAPYKLTSQIGILVFLILLNLRGVKESIRVLAPVFLLFIGTHLFMILYGVFSHLSGFPEIFRNASTDFQTTGATLGFAPVAFILLRAYSMGAGTYTGIEAVSNGVTMLREPRVKTGKRTMFMMATSLAFTAGGILFCYMLTNSQPVAGKTMNAVLMENLFTGRWTIAGVEIGRGLVIVTLVAEALLLFVAAQTGFLGGPRVLSNMATDSWMPHRFSELSDRLVTKNGVVFMGLAAIGTLLYARGHITTLVVMYSINVFVTFVLTELGMSLHSIKNRHSSTEWKKILLLHGTGFVMCLGILTATVIEKFAEGGWMTLLITGLTIALAFAIRGHYDHVQQGFRTLDEVLQAAELPELPEVRPPLDKSEWTAILPVHSFSGYGVHHLLAIEKLFPDQFKNVIFVTAGIIDSGNFKGTQEIANLELTTRENLVKYLKWCQLRNINADYRMTLSTEPVAAVEKICRQAAKEFPKSIIFMGKLIFRRERWYQRILHHETAYALQRRLQLDGIPTMVLPIRA